MKTQQQFEEQIARCKELFLKKASDYGTSWRIMRPASITDQIFIKANRVRSIQTSGVKMVDEGEEPEFIGMVNYAIMGLIQLEKGFADTADFDVATAEHFYDKYANLAKELMLRKNHDYGEAWRSMRVSSFTDVILQKLHRTKQIEDNKGVTQISEGVDANYQDMINYSIFALIKLVVEK